LEPHRLKKERGGRCGHGTCAREQVTVMGIVENNVKSLPFVRAELNYLAPTTERPRTYAFAPPPGEPQSTLVSEPHLVPVFDVRPIVDSLSLDRQGFLLARHQTSVGISAMRMRSRGSTIPKRRRSSVRP
jgi:hypothetical protein